MSEVLVRVARTAGIAARAAALCRRAEGEDRSHLRRSPPADEGFTLLEVIVAIAILAGGLTILLNVTSNGLTQTARAENGSMAVALAQSLLAEVGTSRPVRDDRASGEFENGFRWQLISERVGDASDRSSWPVAAYRVRAEILWNDGARERTFALTTLRLGSKEASR